MPQTLEHEHIQADTQMVDLTQALFGDGSAPRTPPNNPLRRRKWMYAAGALAIVVAGGAATLGSKAAAPAYSAAQVKRTNLANTISATGRLQALTTVQVGTQVSGTISELYADFNSQVKKGQVIARLDPSQLQAQLTQVTANLAAADASVNTAQSAVLSADAAVQAAEANLQRLDSVVADAEWNDKNIKELVAAGVTPRKDIQAAEAALTQALAQKQQGTAQLTQARAQAQSARSQLQQARAQRTQAAASVELATVNLEKTVIRAPIDGIIVSRNVDIGQTVAASLQAPTLFLIANDLKRMQVLADIDEADVGQLQPHSKVSFTVDAYPSETFEGRISQIRLSPQTVQNVVTYTAVIDVDNSELKLKPGMTASISATVSEQRDVLAVPNAALRFRPEGAAPARSRPGSGTVYRIAGEQLEPVSIRAGMTDGVSTQVVSGELREGDRIAIPGRQADKPAVAPRGMMGMGGTRRMR